MYLLMTLFLACSGRSTSGTAPHSTSGVESAPLNLNDLSLKTLRGDPLPVADLTDKVVLYVNVASNCGFTGQYEGLQSLYEEYREAGLVIVGVPCNQFGGQEPGKPVEIATFCKKNYGVTFPLLEKQDVNGDQRSSLYSALINSPSGKGKNVRWNFEKFLVGRDGVVIKRFGSSTSPDSSKLTEAIKAAL